MFLGNFITVSEEGEDISLGGFSATADVDRELVTDTGALFLTSDGETIIVSD